MHRSISDLPPELILQIYTNLPTPSLITFLNRTSRKFYQIWYRDAATISGKVLSRSLEHYDTLLELRELSCLIDLGYSFGYEELEDIARFQAQAQKGARNHVAEARSKGYRGLSSSHVMLGTVVNKNKDLMSNARIAAHLCVLYEQSASQGTSMTTGQDPGRLTERRDILAAFYDMWIICVLGLLTVGRERLEATDKKALDGMVKVARFLVFDCPMDGLHQLSIAAKETPRMAEGFEEIYGTRVPKEFDGFWWDTLRAISYVSGDHSMKLRLHELP